MARCFVYGTIITQKYKNRVGFHTFGQGFPKKPGGRFMLYEYEGSLGGEPLQGAAIYGYNQAKEQFEAAWVDSFHNGSALMYSVGAGWPATVGPRLFTAWALTRTPPAGQTGAGPRWSSSPTQTT